MFIFSVHSGFGFYFQRIQIVWLQARETKIAFRDFSFGLRQRERQIHNTSNFMINVFVRVLKSFYKEKF